MKRLKLKIAMVAVVAAVAGTVTYQNQTKEVGMSELAMANVEALARGEGSGSIIYCCTNTGKCMIVYDSNGSSHTVAGIKFSTPCP